MDYKEKVIALLNSQELSKEQKEKLENIFPELKESEDERMRNAAINACKYMIDNFENSTKQYEDAIAWLEKQGEQKPAFEMKTPEESLGIDSDTYNKIVDECIYGEQKPADNAEPKFKVKYAGSEYNVLEVKEIAGVTYYGIEDEPNHIDYVLPDNCEIVSEQKPTDIQSIEKRAHEVFPDDDDANTPFYRQAFIDGAVDYIDCGCKKSSAWSEEDMEMIRTLVAIFEVNYPNGFYKVNPIGTTNMQGIHSSEIIKWLKSLRPRLHWKPSDEQMDALETAVSSLQSTALESLYQDLKRL